MAESKVITGGGRIYRRYSNASWWMDFNVNGRRYRRSTYWKDADRAIAALIETRDSLRAQVADDKNARVVTASRNTDGDWQGVNGKLPWVVYMFSRAKKNAASRGISFLLTADDLVSLLKASGGRCAITGVAFSDEAFGMWHPYRPSLDRVDSSGPYSMANCRVICVCANMACHAWGEEVFRKVARTMVARELLGAAGHETDTISKPDALKQKIVRA